MFEKFQNNPKIIFTKSFEIEYSGYFTPNYDVFNIIYECRDYYEIIY